MSDRSERDGEEGRSNAWRSEKRGCCGPWMAEAGRACPCSPTSRGGRLALLAFLAGITVAFLVSQVGGILGIVAFVRTL